MLADDFQRFRTIQRLLDRLDPDGEPQASILPGSPNPQGAVVVFPGSFNPPTNAHLAMLHGAQRFEQSRDKGLVYAAISKRTTDKENIDRPLLVDRLALLETLLQQYTPGAGIMLFNRGLYVEQALAIRDTFPGVTKLYFLLGFDKIVQIFDAHYYTDRDAALLELFSLAGILVTPRGKDGARELQALLERPENRRFADYVHLLALNTVYRSISSTHIRQNFAGYQHDVPPEVARFIRETGAYQLPVEQPDGTRKDVYGERIAAINGSLYGDDPPGDPCGRQVC